MRRKSLLVTAVATVCILALANPASAHFINTGFHFTYQSHEQCVKNATDVGHPPAGGAFKGKVESWSWAFAPWGSQDCYYRVDDPLAVSNIGWKWTGSQWGLCFQSDYYYVYAHSAIHLNQWTSSAPCGPGYYLNDSNGWVWHNNAWVGGTIQSYMYVNPFYHWLPS